VAADNVGSQRRSKKFLRDQFLRAEFLRAKFLRAKFLRAKFLRAEIAAGKLRNGPILRFGWILNRSFRSTRGNLRVGCGGFHAGEGCLLLARNPGAGYQP